MLALSGALYVTKRHKNPKESHFSNCFNLRQQFFKTVATTVPIRNCAAQFFFGPSLCIKMQFLRWPYQTNFEIRDSDFTYTKMFIGVLKVGGQFLRKRCQWINFLGRLCGNCEFHNIMALEQFSKSNCTSFISCQRTVKNCSRNLNILYRKTKLFER